MNAFPRLTTSFSNPNARMVIGQSSPSANPHVTAVSSYTFPSSSTPSDAMIPVTVNAMTKYAIVNTTGGMDDGMFCPLLRVVFCV